MGKLTLKFGERILQEVPLGASPITIGRALDSDIPIDNPTVSHNHARIYQQEGQLVIEDLSSANGVLVNDHAVSREALKTGDTIRIGKHVILVDRERDVAIFGKTRKINAPQLQETFVVGVKKQGGANASSAAVADLPAVQTRTRVPTLLVLRGKTEKPEYLLSVKLLVIGKSPMATIQMRGWFAPEVAAQINRREDGYYLIAAGRRAPKLNGQPVTRMTRLNDGDRIQLRGLTLEFVDRD